LLKFIKNEYNKVLDLELQLKLASDIALGMNYLHCEAPFQIIHRDLKSDNSKWKFSIFFQI